MSGVPGVDAPHCPKCRLPLRPLKSAGVTLDACVECKGLWFDGGEVERVIGVGTARPFREQLAGLGSRVRGAACLRGHGSMREVTLEVDEHRTVVSGCPQCGGVWIDRGDLVRIRPHLPQPSVASDERIEGLELQVDEAQREADDRRIGAIESGVESGKRHWIFQFLFGLPLEVYNPVRNKPFATYTLIALNVLVSIAQMLSPNGLIDRFALVPSAFIHGVVPWTILTSMFMHGGLLHLLGNMYFLGVFGDNVEDRMGVAEYLGLYLLGGIVAALAHIASDPASSIPLVGASGAISAVMGAYVYLFPQRRIYLMIFFMLKRIPAIWYLGIWLALQIYFASLGGPGVAWWAHIGGFIIGVATAHLHRTVVRRRLETAAR